MQTFYLTPVFLLMNKFPFVVISKINTSVNGINNLDMKLYYFDIQPYDKKAVINILLLESAETKGMMSLGTFQKTIPNFVLRFPYRCCPCEWKCFQINLRSLLRSLSCDFSSPSAFLFRHLQGNVASIYFLCAKKRRVPTKFAFLFLFCRSHLSSEQQEMSI